MRQAKVVGTPLEAHVRLRAAGAEADLLEQYRDALPMLFIVSTVTLEKVAEADAPLHVEVSRADGTKCIRCWRYVPRVAADEHHAGLCDRCVDAVSETSAGAGR